MAHPAAGRRRHAGDERHHRLRVRAGVLLLKHKGTHLNERIQFQINILKTLGYCSVIGVKYLDLGKVQVDRIQKETPQHEGYCGRHESRGVFCISGPHHDALTLP